MLNFLQKKTKIIIDTNFLLIPGELGIDIFSEIQRLINEPHDLYVLDKTIEELSKIIKKPQTKEGFNAKLGYIMIKQKNLKTLTSSKDLYADKAILEIAEKDPKSVIVATQDSVLKKALKEMSVRVITLRQKKYLEMG